LFGRRRRQSGAEISVKKEARVPRIEEFGMKNWMTVVIAGLVMGAGAWAQKPPLLAEKDVAAIAGEMSGEAAKRNLEGIARFHRQRGSKGFHEAAELVAERLRAYGLSDVAILQFPADGKIFYGTQKSRPGWDADVGDLSETKIVREAGNGPSQKVFRVTELKIASYEAEPVVLAEDSESADVIAELVDVGEGTKASDYARKDVKGRMVLVSAQPGAVQDLAVGKFGAVGIVSYAQNQRTAWSGENLDAIRWGHLETFSANKTFGFMVSLRTAHAFQQRLAKGEQIRLRAVVKAGHDVGNYEVVTATIPGADAKLKDEEIAFSCHLDHQRPGANDNASGCATILEVARMLQKLIGEGKLARPARTIRFIFPPEIEGTLALLNGKPEFAKRIKAVVHMDMVGGGPETKAVFHLTRGPMSLPSFVQDVAWAFAEWVNEESYEFAATGKAAYPMVSAEGGKEPLRAEYSAYTMGSDHDVYQDSSFGIPAIYLNDWPDRFIHTNLDSAVNIDATKLKRAGFIGAASGYFLASQTKFNGFSVWLAIKQGQFVRQELRGWREQGLMMPDRGHMEISSCPYERAIELEVIALSRTYDDEYEGAGLKPRECWTFYAPVGKLAANLEEALKLKFRRKTEPHGPMAVFGFDYFEAEWVKQGHTTKPKLLEYEGLWGGGEEYAYEVLNFADGKRNAQEIQDAVSAEYGPVALELVVEYLKALEEIGVVEKMK
jgi:aminopeptidase YwaD